jgi:hypothetical protein
LIASFTHPHSSFAIHALIDGGYFLNPAAPLGMLEIENRLRWPMKVIRNIGYLLVQRLDGVA